MSDEDALRRYRLSINEIDERGHMTWPAYKVVKLADLLAAWRHQEEQRMEKSFDVPLTPPNTSAPQTMADAAEMLWVVLANVSGGDWKQQPQEWQEAAARWRDNYFVVLGAEAQLAAGPVPEEPSIVLRIEVDQEDDKTYCASYSRYFTPEHPRGQESGCGDYGATPIGAVANLVATLIKVDEDTSIERASAALRVPARPEPER